MSRPRLLALLLAFTTLLVFLPVGWHPFLNFDDPDYVTDNPFVEDGLSWTGIKWAFTTFHAANWHPLTWISHQADCELFGLNPGAQHMMNVFFHAINTVLLFVLLWRLTRELWAAAMIAALFAWHPLHIESVAWIAERKDVLSVCFALLTWLAYVRYVQIRGDGDRDASSRTALWLAFFFFALGLLAKPMLVTLPFTLLLLDFWPLRRLTVQPFSKADFWGLAREKWPFFLLAAASCGITFLAQKTGDAVATFASVTFAHRLENAIWAIAAYLLKFAWPANLCVIYPLYPISPWQLSLSGLTIISISVAAWHWRKDKPYLLFGWLWFLGMLVPVIGLVQVGTQSMADRYTYLPSIGVFTALVFLVRDAVARNGLPRAVVAGFATLLLLACIWATEFQLQFWRSDEALFQRAIAVTHENALAHENLGYALQISHRYEDALSAYLVVEKMETSTNYQLHNNLGNLLGLMGRHDESLAEYQITIRLQPNHAFPHYAAGSELALLGKYDAALAEFAAAEKLDPQYPWPHFDTAKVFLKLNRETEAVQEFQVATQLAPDNFQLLAMTARYLAANENGRGRDGSSALKLALKADQLSKHFQPMVLDVLGMAYAETGDFVQAQACVQEAIDNGAAVEPKNLELFRQRLELYKQNHPWRESFGDTNAP